MTDFESGIIEMLCRIANGLNGLSLAIHEHSDSVTLLARATAGEFEDSGEVENLPTSLD